MGYFVVIRKKYCVSAAVTNIISYVFDNLNMVESYHHIILYLIEGILSIFRDFRQMYKLFFGIF